MCTILCQFFKFWIKLASFSWHDVELTLFDLKHVKLHFLYFLHLRDWHIQFGTRKLTGNNDGLLYCVTFTVLQLYELECLLAKQITEAFTHHICTHAYPPITWFNDISVTIVKIPWGIQFFFLCSHAVTWNNIPMLFMRSHGIRIFPEISFV